MPNTLNRTQKKFCNLPPNKNVRLLAPAGSGKTYSLLWRCKYIADKAKETGGQTPYFLLVAFTRAAKLEMEDRLKNSPDFEGVHATVRTLNAWGWEQVGRPGKKLIISRKEKQDVILHDLGPILRKYPRISKGLESSYGRIVNSVDLLELMDMYKSLCFVYAGDKLASPFLHETGLV